MASKRPATIAEYIDTAPSVGQPHLRKLYALLKSVAPKADEAIKWGTPFFVEPRFLFAFSAHKAHLNFTLTPSTRAAFRKDLQKHRTTQHMLQVRYDEPLPTALIRKLARHRLRHVHDSDDEGFW
jgi:uncharacterized protein YdhG (YjbR/CyaY superfamily)